MHPSAPDGAHEPTWLPGLGVGDAPVKPTGGHRRRHPDAGRRQGGGAARNPGDRGEPGPGLPHQPGRAARARAPGPGVVGGPGAVVRCRRPGSGWPGGLVWTRASAMGLYWLSRSVSAARYPPEGSAWTSHIEHGHLEPRSPYLVALPVVAEAASTVDRELKRYSASVEARRPGGTEALFGDLAGATHGDEGLLVGDRSVGRADGRSGPPPKSGPPWRRRSRFEGLGLLGEHRPPSVRASRAGKGPRGDVGAVVGVPPEVGVADARDPQALELVGATDRGEGDAVVDPETL